MGQDQLVIEYRISAKEADPLYFRIVLHPETLERLDVSEGEPPHWTALEHNKCANCPLNPRLHPTCPLALRLVPLAQAFDQTLSYDELTVEVAMTERTITQETTAQRALSSLMGLVMATSGCPHLVFFRPMARFHLPLASEPETVYRAVSSWLMAQFFNQLEGRPATFDLAGLNGIYDEVQVVNTAIAGRLREATQGDSSVNAVIILDMLAKSLPYVFGDSLALLRPWFTPYLGPPPG